MLNSELVEMEEDRIRGEVERLGQEQRKLYFQRYARLVKDPDTYAALNWAAFAGLHDFYLGRWIKGLIELWAFAIGLLLVVGGIPLGWLLLIGVFLWEGWELMRSQVIVRDYNNRVARTLLHELHLDASRPAAGRLPPPG